MLEHLIQCNHFNVKHDGNIDFSFDKKNRSAGTGKKFRYFHVGIFDFFHRESNPGLQITSLACLPLDYERYLTIKMVTLVKYLR